MSSLEGPPVLSPESDVTNMSFEDTELTLGLPGEERSSSSAAAFVFKCSAKRGYIETVDLNLGNSTSKPPAEKPPAAKEQVVGWPPLRSWRNKAINESCKYVKVAVDGAPYLRKVNLQGYSNYDHLLKDLHNFFSCFTIPDRNSDSDSEEIKLKDMVKEIEYVPTYEDKDGDWMLVGDVPWKMFTESCKRIRLMKSSKAGVLAPKASPKC